MKTYKLLGILTILALLIAVTPVQTVQAAVLCVNPGGTDGCYATIQAAITAAAAGDTIHVAAGVYYERNILVNKSVTILGDPGDTSPGPGSNAPVIDGSSAPGDAFLIANGVSNVTIQGFEIRNYTSDDTGIGNAVSAWVGSTSYITIQDNYFHNLGWNGVLVGNDKSSNPSKWGDHTNWLIKGNILETFEAYGFELTNTSNSIIENNVIHSNATWNLAATCIMVDARRNASGIVIKGNEIDGETWPWYPAVFVFANSFETPNVNLNDVLIENNIVSTTSSTATAQVTVYNYAGTGTVTGVQIHHNSLSTFRNGTPIMIDATSNWWGSNLAADVEAAIKGDVNFTPWLCSGFDASDAPGFQPADDALCPYQFDGFFRPIENLEVNTAKAGQAIPAKWQLTDYTGVIVSDPASFVSLYSYPVNCTDFTGDPADAIVETFSGSSGLQYDDGYWQFNWKTSRAYAGTCRVMYIQFSDGTVSPAVNFRFR